MSEADTFSLTAAQRALWVGAGTTADGAQPIEGCLVRVSGRLDRGRLITAITDVVGEQSALRIACEFGTDLPVQRVHPRVRIDLASIDLSARAEDVAAEEARRWATGLVTTPFDLSRPPLWRAGVAALPGGESIIVLAAHHMICDGWSLRLLLDSIGEHYVAGAPRNGSAGSATRYPTALLEREATRKADEKTLGYWRSIVENRASTPLTPSPDRAADAAGRQGAQVSTVLRPELAESLRLLARATRSTPSVVFLACYAAVLARLTGDDRVPIGTVTHGRPTPELKQLVGLFASTLVVPTDVSGGPTVEELLRRVRGDYKDTLAHREVSLEELTAGHDLVRAPLFRHLIAYHSTDLSITRFAGLPATLELVSGGAFTRELELHVREISDGYELQLRHNPGQIGREHAESILRAFVSALCEFVANPRNAISSMSFLPADEWGRLAAWNETRRDFEAASLPELLAAGVGSGRGVAVVDAAGSEVSRGQLWARAGDVASCLRRLGVGAGSLVGVCCERSVELVVALLGVVRAGAAFVPLDPSFPRGRLELMADDCTLDVVLTQRGPHESLPAGVTCLYLDEPLDECGTETLDVRAGDADPAYVMYTSGSTGRPKGVVVSYKALRNLTLWLQDTFPLRPGDRVLQKTPMSFDVSLAEFFWPLLPGATIVLAEPSGHRDSAYLARLATERRVTAMHFVPSMLRQFLDEPDVPNLAGGSLRQVYSAGEALPVELAERFHELLPGVELHNLYGPTEAAVFSTWWDCQRSGPPHTVPIGRPAANTTAFVLDHNLRPVPVGTPGELYLGGVQLADGYLNQPALTAQRFPANPLPFGGPRLYRTGDRARLLPDGTIEYLGRVDAQVKLRGQRVEPAEIDHVLATHPGVRDAVTILRTDLPTGPYLASYVVTHTRAPATAELRHHLAAHLPPHAVPTTITALTTLPLSPNGKVDRGALPAPVHQPTARRTPPRNDHEATVADIWQTLLGATDIGVHDNFFDLGGHSLVAMQVVARIRDLCEVEIPASALFDGASTVADLAVLVERGSAGADLPQVRKASRTEHLPLSYQQEQLWLTQQLHHGLTAYNGVASVHMRGELAADCLAAAVDDLQARHEILRTRFPTLAGRPVQRIEPAVDLPVETVDLSRVPVTERTVRVELAMIEAGRTVFDLAAGPLLTLRLLRLAPDEHVLVVAEHHLIHDGWSLQILMRDLVELYGARTTGRSPRLSELSVQYADFAVWQREHLGGPTRDRLLSYWRRQLADAPELLALPTDRPRPAEQSFAGHQETITIDAGLARAVREFAAQRRVTEFMAMVTAFVALMHRYSEQDDFTVGTPVANRRRSESEDLLGFVANTIVLRADVTGAPSFDTLLGRVRRTCLGAYDHQDMPFELLVDELSSGRSLAAAPLFQVAFSIVDDPLTTHEAGGVTFDLVEWHNDTAKFDLNMVVVPPAGPDGETVIRLEHRTDLFDPASARRVLQSYAALLAAMVADPDRLVRDVPVLPFGQHWPTSLDPAAALTTEADRPVPGLFGAREMRRQALARIWSDVLGVPIGPDDDFFELGGNSLLAADVVARVGEAFGREISLRTLFELPTVDELASVLDGAEPALADRPALTPTAAVEHRELSFAQYRLWFLEQLNPGTTAYNMYGCRRLLGALDVELLERCVRTILSRHETLRTRFPSVGGQPTVVVDDQLDWRIRVDDLSDFGAEAAEAARKLSAEEADTPFDLEHGPLLRCRLLRLGETEHLLLVSFHHIVADAWSLGLFLAELAGLYSAEGDAAEANLPALPVQYHDYASWQRELLSEDHMDRLLDYWTEHLADAPTAIDLPARRSRTPAQEFAGGMTSLLLPADTSAAVRALGVEAGTTTFMTLLAAMGTVLCRWTRQEDMVIGVPVAIRDAPETRGLIGFFMNTLAMRVDLSGRPTFSELLGRVRETSLDAYLHQALPFEQLVENLPVDRDLGRSPLFQVMLNVVNVAEGTQELRGVTVEDVEVPPPTTKFDLTLYARESAGRLRFDLNFRADLYDADLMTALLDQIATLLAGAATNPHLPVHRYPLCAADDEEPTPVTDTGQQLDHELAHRAELAPESVAIVDRDGVWPWRRLDEAADRFGQLLLERDVDPAGMVGIEARRHGGLLAAMVGCFRLNVPFTVLAPGARIDTYVVLDPDADPEPTRAAPLTPVRAAGHTSACVVLTSGTTGEPRAVAVNHAALLRFGSWQAETFGLTDTDRVAVLHGPAHESFVAATFGALRAGAHLCLPDDGDVATAPALLSWLRDNGITVVHADLRTLRLLDGDAGALPALRYVLVRGDTPHSSNLTALRRLAPDARCVSIYGAAEVPGGIGYRLMSAGGTGSATCTAGVSAAHVVLQNDSGGPVALGEIGEVLVRAPDLPDGYLGRAAATAQRFVPDPARPGGRLFRTGDLGRRLPGGGVQVLGPRLLDLSVRGQRVDVDRVTHALLADPAVRDAAVIARRGPADTAELVAYVVLDGPPPADLRARVAREAPDHAVLSQIVPLDALPLTRNGRLDRSALPAPGAVAAPAEAPVVAPRTPVEEQLAVLYREVLDVSRVGVHDSFFDLGGHSLSATQLASRVKSTFMVELPLREFFEATTVAQLAVRVVHAQARLAPESELAALLDELE
ncbi:amino acid adenylation domain-containing protein [Actinophytocola sp.]|uniref:amino acid adenylation domain-containing protein n=1 Tax=Actinophytocola sp. TaxID=1872138 RepID=UPI003D6AB01C